MADVQFFKDTLNSEIKRITELCQEWEKILCENIPEDVHGKILSVIGQSKLLMNEKFQQFRDLINSCNSLHFNRSCNITVEDLRGFWDLLNIQINDLNRKFDDLNKLRSNHWNKMQEMIQQPQPGSNQGVNRLRRQNSCDKIHSEQAKLRIAAAKEKLQERMAKEALKNDSFIIF